MVKCTPVVPLNASKPEDDVRLSFAEAFGKLGPPVLLVALVSMLWTIGLMCLNIAPNATANYLMDTGAFDNGDFWLILRPEPVLLVSTLLSLAAIVVMHGVVILRMTFWRNAVAGRSVFGEVGRGDVFNSRSVLKAKKVWQDITGFNGRWRKHWNLILKTVDLTLQMLTLHRILEYGFAPALCFGYAALIAVNALSCAAFILSRSNHSALTEVLIDAIFDTLFAVGAPIMLLLYAYSHFDLDRAQARLILEITSPVNFSRQARLMADPKQTSTFLLSFDALRTNTWSGLAVQAVMNMSLSHRLLRVIQVFSESRRHTHRHVSAVPAGKSSTSAVAKSIAYPSNAQERVPRAFSIVFVAVGAIAIIVTHEAIAHSTQRCKEFSQCAAFAHRWAYDISCPCLAYIDVDKAPKTYNEWINPKDVTDTLAALATSGDLQVLNIINRRLRVLPDELSRCKNMQYISLMYTDLEEIPFWAASFTRLEYLSVEGKLYGKNIVKMPNDLFDDMSVLTNVHFGIHFNLKQLPRLDGLENLNGLSLALLASLTEIPDLSKLLKLQRLELVVLPSLKQLPNISYGVSLSRLALMLSLPCCNGFLGNCDLTLSACIGMDPDACLPNNFETQVLNANTQTQIAAYSSTICTADQVFRGIPMEVAYIGPTKEQAAKCQGVMYRECSFDTNANRSVGHSICINDRLQVIHCVLSNEAIELRRREISGNIGTPCDPEVEAWLGCKSPV